MQTIDEIQARCIGRQRLAVFAIEGDRFFDQLTSVVCMTSAQRNGAFTIDQSGYVSSIDLREWRYLPVTPRAVVHPHGSSIKGAPLTG